MSFDPDYHGIPASARRDGIFTGEMLKPGIARNILGTDDLATLVAILQNANEQAMLVDRNVSRHRAICRIVQRLGIEFEFLAG